MAEKEQLLLRDIPQELKLALMQAAEYGQTNMQAVAVSILAKEFDYDYSPRHVRGNPADEKKNIMNLRLPPELHQRIRIKAAGEGIAYADVAVLALGKHLGVEIDPKYLNRRGRRAA